MRLSCAMMALRVTLPAEEEEGVEVDGVKEVEGVTISVRDSFG